MFQVTSCWLGETTSYQNKICPIGKTCTTVMVNYAILITSSGMSLEEVGDTLSLRPVIVISREYIDGGSTVVNESSSYSSTTSDTNLITDESTSTTSTTNDSNVSTNMDTTIDTNVSTTTTTITMVTTTETKEEVENPTTGAYISTEILFSGLLTGVAYIFTGKKKYFVKIK